MARLHERVARRLGRRRAAIRPSDRPEPISVESVEANRATTRCLISGPNTAATAGTGPAGSRPAPSGRTAAIAMTIRTMHRQQDQHPPARQHVAEVHQLLRDPRQFLSGLLDLLADRRNHLGRQNHDGHQAEADQDHRVDHRRQHLRFHPLAFLHEARDGLEALAQGAGDLADADHGHVDHVEVVVVVLQGVGERFARDDAVADLGQGGLEPLVRASACVRTDSASVSLIPEFSSVASCFVKSMSCDLLIRRSRTNKAAPALRAPEVTSVMEEGCTLRIRNCLRAANGLSAVIVPSPSCRCPRSLCTRISA